MRYACPQNAIYALVNSAFSGYASLKIPLVIQLYKKVIMPKVVALTRRTTTSLFLQRVRLHLIELLPALAWWVADE